MTPPLLGNLAANQYSERHFLIFSPILCNSPVVTFTQQFKTIDSNNFTLFSMFSFQNAWPLKKKSCAYCSTFPYIHSFPCGMYFKSVFFKSTSFILVNLQAVASGGKIRRTLIMHDKDNDNKQKTT